MPAKIDYKLLLRLFLPFFAVHCTEQVYFVIVPLFKQNGISPEVIGWLISVYFISIMTFRPAASWLLETFGIRKTLLWSGLLALVGTLALAMFPASVPMLFLGRILTGISFSIYSGGIFAYQAVIVPPEMRGAIFALVATGGMLPLATITPVGEWLLLSGHPVLYLLLGSVAAAACVFFATTISGGATISARHEEEWGTYRDLFAERPFRVIMITAVFMSLVDSTTVCMSLLAAERGLAASYFLTTSAISGVAVRVIGSHSLDRIPRKLCIGPMLGLMSASLLVISFIPSNTVLAVAGTTFGIGIGIGWPVFLSLVSDMIPVPIRPKGTSTALLTYDSGWMITPLIVGYATAIVGVAWTFRLLALVGLAAAVLLQWFGWQPLIRQEKEVGI